VQIGNKNPEELIFWTQRFPEKHLRRASMLRKAADGQERGVPNVTYDLRGSELLAMMKSVGFVNIKQIKLKSDSHFTAWIAQKE
jgi:hypothetical protein